ncbi:MAG: cyclic lactone autoinducer peptide [Lachnospiraceae bacterium]|nr:cyclic lactone autoinducer peptide [Lachnospiraceae bacterium]
MKNLKKAIVKLGEHIAIESVGKSCPAYFYEPKVPAALKEKVSKDCK